MVLTYDITGSHFPCQENEAPAGHDSLRFTLQSQLLHRRHPSSTNYMCTETRWEEWKRYQKRASPSTYKYELLFWVHVWPRHLDLQPGPALYHPPDKLRHQNLSPSNRDLIWELTEENQTSPPLTPTALLQPSRRSSYSCRLDSEIWFTTKFPRAKTHTFKGENHSTWANSLFHCH